MREDSSIEPRLTRSNTIRGVSFKPLQSEATFKKPQSGPVKTKARLKYSTRATPTPEVSESVESAKSTDLTAHPHIRKVLLKDKLEKIEAQIILQERWDMLKEARAKALKDGQALYVMYNYESIKSTTKCSAELFIAEAQVTIHHRFDKHMPYVCRVKTDKFRAVPMKDHGLGEIRDLIKRDVEFVKTAHTLPIFRDPDLDQPIEYIDLTDVEGVGRDGRWISSRANTKVHLWLIKRRD